MIVDIYTTLMTLMCAQQSVNPNIYLLNAGLGSRVTPPQDSCGRLFSSSLCVSDLLTDAGKPI